MKATREILGESSLSIWSHFATIGKSIKLKPVALPPGRARLLNKSLPDRIGDRHEDHRDRAGLAQQGAYPQRTIGDDYVRFKPHKFGRIGLSKPGISGGPANVDVSVATDRPSSADRPGDCDWPGLREQSWFEFSANPSVRSPTWSCACTAVFAVRTATITAATRNAPWFASPPGVLHLNNSAFAAGVPLPAGCADFLVRFGCFIIIASDCKHRETAVPSASCL